MSIYELDEKGEIDAAESCQGVPGIEKRVLVINAGDHLKIIPLPSDPLKTLHGAFNSRKTFRELREEAEGTAEREVERS